MFNAVSIISIVLAVIYVVFGVIHLRFCFKENEKMRRITKPFCMVPLIIISILNVPAHPFIFLAPLAALVGDILLIWRKKNIFFITGTLCFLAGHILYLLQIVSNIKEVGHVVPYWVFIIVFSLVVILTFALYPLTSKFSGKLSFLGNFYFSLMMAVEIFSIILTVYMPNKLIGVLIDLGYLIFISSDTVVIYTKFNKHFKRDHFVIMLTYLVSQLLILSGLILFEVL